MPIDWEKEISAAPETKTNWEAETVQAPQPQGPVSLEQRTQEMFGFEPGLKRASLLPFGTRPSGEITPAVPQIGVDLAQSALLPGHVKKGGEYTAQDVARFTLDYGIPAHSPTAGGAMMQKRPPKAPTTEQLRDLASASYKSAEQAGVVISQPSFSGAADDIAGSVANMGYHPRLHPRISVVLDELENMKGAAPTLEQAEIFRRIARSAAASQDAHERKLAETVINKLDDFVEGLGKDQLVSGDPKGIKSLTKARDLWKRNRRGEVIEEVIDRAGNRAGQFSGSGYENALRTEFRNLAQSAKKMRGFSKGEQNAIRLVARGGPIGNAMRYLGKLAPRGVISGGANIAIGAATEPIIGFGSMLAGETGRRAATAITSRNAQKAAELARMGTRKPAPTLQEVSPNMRKALRLFGPLLGIQ